MHWIYLLSSDTKWDDLYIFKLEVNPLWQRDKEVTWGSPFWETSIEITVLWSSDMSLQIAYQLYSGMILEEVIKQMVVIKKCDDDDDADDDADGGGAVLSKIQW